jgi:hypothetical protein
LFYNDVDKNTDTPLKVFVNPSPFLHRDTLAEDVTIAPDVKYFVGMVIFLIF